MPLLSCTAVSCEYNKNEYCSKGDIQVDGPTAQTPDETCCRSFVERREETTNSIDTGAPYQTIQIDCKACSCTYNDNEKCEAAKITIAGNGACRCEETECGSFCKK